MTAKKLDVTKIVGKRIWAMGAHSDDLEFACAGTLSLLAKNNEVGIVVVTDGKLGTHEYEVDKQALINSRINEARKSGEIMGVKEVHFWSYPDWGLADRKKHLMKKMIKWWLKQRPEIVISFDPWGKYEPYIHSDHRTLAWSVVESLMLATLPQWVVKHKLGKRMLSPKPQVWLMWPDESNVVVDVSSVWGKRMESLRVFESQFDKEVDINRMERWVTNNAAWVGEKIGVGYGEEFRILDYEGEWDEIE